MQPSFIEEELQNLRDESLYRVLRTLKPVAANRCLLENREILLFCSNDYLGLSQDPGVLAAAHEALDTYGAGAGAARLISGSTDVHERLEKRIAALKGKERALVFSAGYLANLGVLSALAGEKDLIILDKLCHASLIDGARLSGAGVRVFPHKNYEKCEAILRQAEHGRKVLLVTDGVFSMDGDSADFEALVRLREKYGCLLIVDDAHATGVSGPGGRASYEGPSGFERRIDVVTGTFSKSAGSLGGFAAASGQIIDYLVNKARPFIFATALPPAVAAAALRAVEIMETNPEPRRRLFRNLEFFRSLLCKGLVSETFGGFPIIPIILGEEKRAQEVAKRLLDEGFLIPAIRYPTVAKGKARLRVTVNALHTEAELKACAEAVNRIAGEA